MHDLFTQVLSRKDLSKAGDLFLISDRLIANDLTDVINKIRDISSLSDYVNNGNDQSVVEICITRVTSAIRETCSIEQHSRALVLLLESCLNHDLKPSSRDEDPPHAKIASDVISCIFLNYSKREVMKLALPVAVKFLHKGNKELSRNMSSYLSLAAIANADLLSEHIQPIIDSVISGNYLLSRVLPQIYNVNKAPIHDHVMVLVSLIPLCENTEKLAILTLCGLIAKNKPTLLEPSLPQLCECLMFPTTSAATLQIFLDMSFIRPQPLLEHIPKMKISSELNPNTIFLSAQVITSVSKLTKEKAQDAVDYLLTLLSIVDQGNHPVLLKEVLALCTCYPILLSDKVIQEVAKYSDSSSSGARILIQQLKNNYAIKTTLSTTRETSGRVTVVRVGGSSGTESKNDLPGLVANSPMLHMSYSPSQFYSRTDTLQQCTLAGRTVAVASSRPKLTEGRSMSRLGSSVHMNRSMTRLNAVQSAAGRLGSSSAGLHKSMTRLNSHQQLNLGLHYPQSSALSVNRSVTALASRGTFQSTNRVSSGNVTVTTSLGSAHPMKSTSFLTSSSGSMSTLREERDVTLVSVTTTFPHHPQAPIISQNLNHSGRDLGLPLVPFSSNMGNYIPLSQSGSRLLCNLNQSQSVTMAGSLSNSGSPLNHSGTAISASSSPVPTVPISVCASTQTSAVTPISTTTSTSPPACTRRTNTSVTVISNNQGTSPMESQRISVFEPFPMRDTVQHFCEKHLDKIKSYMTKILIKIPLPVKCTIEERKSKKHAKLHFACQGKGDHCLYSKTLFTMKTRNPRVWIHLMFLGLQARSSSALSTRETSVSSLKHCWDILKCENRTFLTLVTSSFPSVKDQDVSLHELRNNGFFDVFEYNDPQTQWGCFLCMHPERALGFLQDTQPVIEGQLKEKKGKWKIFKRWRTKYFTLSGAHLSYRGSNDKDVTPIQIAQIRSVKVTRGGRNIPKAFEIFTNEKSFVLKAKDGKNAEEWVQCLSIVVAHSQAKEGPSKASSLQGHVRSLKTAL